MKALKTLLVVALSGLIMVGGNAMAQLQTKAANQAPKFSAAKQQSMQSQQVSFKEAKAAMESNKAVKTAAKQDFTGSLEIKYVARPVAKNAAKDETKAKIWFIVDKNRYNDGSGQTLYIDKDATAYEENGGSMVAADKLADFFEYTIPEGAMDDPFAESSSVWEGDEQSIEVDPGTYDVWIANPDNGTFYSIGWLNDIPLKAGWELNVIFSEEGQYYQLVMPYDIAMVGLVEPVRASNSYTAEEEVVVKVGNGGMEQITNFTLKYRFDEGEWFTQTVEQIIVSGETENIALEHNADLTAGGVHNITVIAEMEGDEYNDNDTLRITLKNLAPITQLPYYYDFNDPEMFAFDWDVDDANQNLKSWEYSTYTGQGGVAYTNTYTYMDEGMPETMIHRCPVHMAPGNYHITFRVRTSASYPEHFELLLGTDTADMGVIKEFVDYTTPGTFDLEYQNITIETEGNYFFGFRAYYTDGLYVMIDDITVAQGKYVGIPDLVVESLVSPISSCGLTAEEDVVVKVKNIGYADIKVLGVKGTLNDVPFSDTLRGLNIKAKGESEDVRIATLDLGTVDQTYLLKFELEDLTDPEVPEDSIRNNKGEFEISNWTPATMPFINDFSRAATMGNWAMGDWGYNEEEYYLYCGGEAPMVSRCMALETDKYYRVTMNFAAGQSFLGWEFYTEYEVLLGKSGTDIDTWKQIQYDDEAFYQEFTDVDFSFGIEEAGEYSIAIRVIESGGMWIQRLNVAEIADYDVRINGFAPVPVMIPAEHANGTYNMWAQVENRGGKKVDAKVSVKVGGTLAGDATVANLEPEAIEETAVELTVGGAVAGTNNVPIVASVEIVGQEDAYPEDNTDYYSVNVTEDVLAYDYVLPQHCTDEYHVVGSSSGTLLCVVPMYVTQKDTLTGISVMWGSTAEEPGTSHETRLVVYNYDHETGEVGTPILDMIDRKVAAAGEQTFTLPASLLLDKGFYLIGASVTGYELTVDGDANGVIYLLSGDNLVGQSGLGNAGIRAKFGHNGVVVSKDATVVSIDKPDGEGYFTENEPVVTWVANYGYEPITATVNLEVDGVAAGEPKTVELGAYGRVKVNFVANLAKVGEHTIVITANCEGDANAENNEMSKTVRTKKIPNVDPYVMDFEYCEDFAISDFIPAWTTVDGDQSENYSFSGLTFPHSGEPFAFMAFNPVLCNPNAEEGWMAPANGERFGASFAAVDAPNNDWLISPKLKINEDNASVSFKAQTYMDYGLEEFEVWVSETSNDLDDFVQVGETTEAELKEWAEYTFDLNAYKGKEVYVAIRCVSNDVFVFMIDDIRITPPNGYVPPVPDDNEANENALKAQLKLYPNPAKQMIVINGAQIENVAIFNLSGRQVYASQNKGNEFRYNVSNLPKGMYFANVKTAQGTVVMKFVVE